MFRVVKTPLPVILEKPDGVRDHGQVLVGRGAEDFRDVQQPGFADDRDDRSLGLEHLAHQFVLVHAHALAAGHAEGGDPGVPEFALAGLLEKLHVRGFDPGQPPSI